jgi:hypothetical protein
MSRRLVLLGAAVLVLGAAAARGQIARAQPTSLPDPGVVRLTPQSNIGTCIGCTTLQAQEPPTGFTGACLLDAMHYQPTLPLARYAPGPTVQYGKGFTNVIFPDAKQVAGSYSTLPAASDSYMVLATCYPHNADGSCPQASFAVSRSCCDYGANIISLDGQTAQGVAIFQ